MDRPSGLGLETGRLRDMGVANDVVTKVGQSTSSPRHLLWPFWKVVTAKRPTVHELGLIVPTSLNRPGSLKNSSTESSFSPLVKETSSTEPGLDVVWNMSVAFSSSSTTKVVPIGWSSLTVVVSSTAWG